MGRSNYNNPVFEFQYYLAKMSVLGHVYQIESEAQFQDWNRVDPIQLFDAPIFPSGNKDMEFVKQNLENEARKCQQLMLWLIDCDREAFEVINTCTRVNRIIQMHRAQFSSLIPREIHLACRSLVQPSKNYSDAVEARMEIDLRFEAAFTRFQTELLKYKCQIPYIWIYN